MRSTLLVLLCLFSLARPAAAQFDSATGVSVVKTTDALGQFEFPAARIGTHLVTAEKEGFAVALADNVQVAVGARVRVDLELQVGQLSEKVEVTAGQRRLETEQPARPGHHRRADAGQDVNPLYGRDQYAGQFTRAAGVAANPSTKSMVIAPTSPAIRWPPRANAPSPTTSTGPTS